MKWEMELEEIEAVLEKIWDLHDKLSDAIHSISRIHFLNSIKTMRKSEKKKPPFNDVAANVEKRTGFIFVKDFRVGDVDVYDSVIQEAKSLNAIRTTLENLEDQLEFFHGSRPIMKFIEEFDFMAMNEKFKKDEVWGHLGKNNKSHSMDKDNADDSESQEDDEDVESLKIEVKAVYNKDDFFDSISCNALDHESYNRRTGFSKQMKIGTETFGEFSRYRGGRGGRGFNHGGRSRGGYYVRGVRFYVPHSF